MAQAIAGAKERVVLGSAVQISELANSSDATLIRTARALGYETLAALREDLLGELIGASAPSGRLERTLDETGSEPARVLSHVVGLQRATLKEIARPDFAASFAAAVELTAAAAVRHVFGIGPSGALADYAALQMNRIGYRALALTRTGVGLADQLATIAVGDVVLIIAYAPLYREVRQVLDRAEARNVPVILVSDSLGPPSSASAQLLCFRCREGERTTSRCTGGPSRSSRRSSWRSPRTIALALSTPSTTSRACAPRSTTNGASAARAAASRRRQRRRAKPPTPPHPDEEHHDQTFPRSPSSQEHDTAPYSVAADFRETTPEGFLPAGVAALELGNRLRSAAIRFVSPEDACPEAAYPANQLRAFGAPRVVPRRLLAGSKRRRRHRPSARLTATYRRPVHRRRLAAVRTVSLVCRPIPFRNRSKPGLMNNFTALASTVTASFLALSR